MPYDDHFDDRYSDRDADCENTLGGRLIHARDTAALSLAKVAKQMDIHPATLNYWEADRAAPALPTLRRLAAILGVSPVWLLTGCGEGPGDRNAEAVPLALVSRHVGRKAHRTPRPDRS